MTYIFLRIWGEAELILGIRGARKNTFRELRIFSGIWEDQCIILRKQGSTDSLGGSEILTFFFFFLFHSKISRTNLNIAKLLL